MTTKTILGLVALTAFANSAVALDAQFIKFSNGLTLTPTLGIDRYYDDNVRNTPSNKVSSQSTTISASANLQVQERSNVYEAYYRLSHNRVSRYRGDDTTSYSLGAGADIGLRGYDRLNIYTSYSKTDSRRDSTNNFYNESGNKSHSTSLGAGYTLAGKQGRVVFNGGYSDLRYDNNYSTGSRTKDKEYNSTNFSTTLYYPILLKTNLLAEVNLRDYNYRSNNLLDSDNRIYRLGLTWEATTKLIGDVRVGREKKQFDANSQGDVSQSSWLASIRWLPLTYSTFTFTSNRYISEGSFSEQYIENTSSTISWNHDWGKYLGYISSSVDYTRRDVKYSGNRNSGRSDDIDDFAVRLTYGFRRWMDLSLNYRHTDTDSNQPISDYDRRLIGLSIDMSL